MMGIEWLRPAAFLGSMLYALIGVFIFWLCFIIIDKITPADLWRELVEKQNQAHLAMDSEGNLSFLAPSEWRLGYVMEQWPDIDFEKTRELE